MKKTKMKMFQKSKKWKIYTISALAAVTLTSTIASTYVTKSVNYTKNNLNKANNSNLVSTSTNNENNQAYLVNDNILSLWDSQEYTDFSDVMSGQYFAVNNVSDYGNWFNSQWESAAFKANTGNTDPLDDLVSFRSLLSDHFLVSNAALNSNIGSSSIINPSNNANTTSNSMAFNSTGNTPALNMQINPYFINGVYNASQFQTIFTEIAESILTNSSGSTYGYPQFGNAQSLTQNTSGGSLIPTNIIIANWNYLAFLVYTGVVTTFSEFQDIIQSTNGLIPADNANLASILSTGPNGQGDLNAQYFCPANLVSSFDTLSASSIIPFFSVKSDNSYWVGNVLQYVYSIMHNSQNENINDLWNNAKLIAISFYDAATTYPTLYLGAEPTGSFKWADFPTVMSSLDSSSSSSSSSSTSSSSSSPTSSSSTSSSDGSSTSSSSTQNHSSDSSSTSSSSTSSSGDSSSSSTSTTSSIVLTTTPSTPTTPSLWSVSDSNTYIYNLITTANTNTTNISDLSTNVPTASGLSTISFNNVFATYNSKFYQNNNVFNFTIGNNTSSISLQTPEWFNNVLNYGISSASIYYLKTLDYNLLSYTMNVSYLTQTTALMATNLVQNNLDTTSMYYTYSLGGLLNNPDLATSQWNNSFNLSSFTKNLKVSDLISANNDLESLSVNFGYWADNVSPVGTSSGDWPLTLTPTDENFVPTLEGWVEKGEASTINPPLNGSGTVDTLTLGLSGLYSSSDIFANTDGGIIFTNLQSTWNPISGTTINTYKTTTYETRDVGGIEKKYPVIENKPIILPTNFLSWNNASISTFTLNGKNTTSDIANDTVYQIISSQLSTSNFINVVYNNANYTTNNSKYTYSSNYVYNQTVLNKNTSNISASKVYGSLNLTSQMNEILVKEFDATYNSLNDSTFTNNGTSTKVSTTYNTVLLTTPTIPFQSLLTTIFTQNSYNYSNLNLTNSLTASSLSQNSNYILDNTLSNSTTNDNAFYSINAIFNNRYNVIDDTQIEDINNDENYNLATLNPLATISVIQNSNDLTTSQTNSWKLMNAILNTSNFTTNTNNGQYFAFINFNAFSYYTNGIWTTPSVPFALYNLSYTASVSNLNTKTINNSTVIQPITYNINSNNPLSEYAKNIANGLIGSTTTSNNLISKDEINLLEQIITLLSNEGLLTQNYQTWNLNNLINNGLIKIVPNSISATTDTLNFTIDFPTITLPSNTVNSYTAVPITLTGFNSMNNPDGSDSNISTTWNQSQVNSNINNHNSQINSLAKANQTNHLIIIVTSVILTVLILAIVVLLTYKKIHTWYKAYKNIRNKRLK